jgi:hypothetical protein
VSPKYSSRHARLEIITRSTRQQVQRNQDVLCAASSATNRRWRTIVEFPPARFHAREKFLPRTGGSGCTFCLCALTGAPNTPLVPLSFGPRSNQDRKSSGPIYRVDVRLVMPAATAVVPHRVFEFFQSKKGGQYHEKTDDPQSGNVEDHERFLHPRMWSSCVKTIRWRWGARDLSWKSVSTMTMDLRLSATDTAC